MSKAKKIALGIVIILAAIAGALVALLDNDPLTKPDIGQVIEDVQEGVDIIKDAGDAEAPAEPTSSLRSGDMESIEKTVFKDIMHSPMEILTMRLLRKPCTVLVYTFDEDLHAKTYVLSYRPGGPLSVGI